eukprot:6281233-Pyramimonas_sp.AAC.1
MATLSPNAARGAPRRDLRSDSLLRGCPGSVSHRVATLNPRAACGARRRGLRSDASPRRRWP